MITKKKIRKIFPPLSVTLTTEVVGNPMQIYDSMLGTWTSDRKNSSNWVKFVPHVMVTTGPNEKTWTDGDYGKSLVDVVWYANGTDIKDVAALSGGYVIGTGTDDMNTLTITKNFTSSEHYDLTFEGKLYDDRQKAYLTVHSDAVQVGISERSEQEWDFSVAHDTNVQYRPLLDKLKEYDWKKSNGIAVTDADYNSCFDGNQYLRTFPIIISHGSVVIDSSNKYWDLCAMRMFIYDENGVSKEYYVSDAEHLSFVTELTTTQMTVDLRLVPGGTNLEVALYLKDKVDSTDMTKWTKMASEFMSFSVIINDYTCETENEGDLDINAQYRYDKAVFTINGKKVQYPEAYFDINWYTNSSDTENGQNIHQGNGETCKIDLSKAYIGKAADCWLEVYVDTKVKALVAAITTDKDGNIVLINSEGKIVTVNMLTN